MLRLALLVGVLLSVAACGGGAAENAGRSPVETSASAGGAAVDFEGETLDGDRFALAELRGKPVFVNVWASW